MSSVLCVRIRCARNTIYTVLIIGLIAGFLGGFFAARKKLELKDINKKISLQKCEGYKMKGEKIIVIKDGVEANMNQDVILSDGTKVGIDGSVVNLQNGETIWADGSMALDQAIIDNFTFGLNSGIITY